MPDDLKIKHGMDCDPDIRVLQVFRMWNKRLLRSAAAHYMAAERHEFREMLLSLFNIIAAITVLFFSAAKDILEKLSNILGIDLDPIVPVLSLVVVSLSATQYIQQNAAKAAMHKAAGNEFSNLRRKLERYWTKESVHSEALHAFNRTYNQIVKSTPLVPKALWVKSLKIKQTECENINSYYFTYNEPAEDLPDLTCP